VAPQVYNSIQHDFDAASVLKAQVYLDLKHSLALLELLLDENLIQKETPVAFNQIKTVGDLVMHRDPSTFHVSAQDKRDTLLLLSMYDEIQLHVPRGLFTMIDLSHIGAAVIPYTDLHDSEWEKWRDLDTVRAKGMLLAYLSILEENPRKRLPRDPLPFDKLFSADDVRDLDALRSLVIAVLGDVWSEAHYHLPEKYDLARAFQDPDYISHLCRDIAKKTGGGQGQPMILFLSLAVCLRDALADVRSLLAYGSDTSSLISWPSATQPPPLQSTPQAKSEEWVVVRALLNELNQVPQPMSIEQARRYRESHRVRALWIQIEQWTSALRVGDLKLETEIRESLTSTSRQLAAAETWSRLAGWASCFSIPVAVVELLAGLPPVAGFAVGAIGGMFGASSRLMRWKNRWLMWN